MDYYTLSKRDTRPCAVCGNKDCLRYDFEEDDGRILVICYYHYRMLVKGGDFMDKKFEPPLRERIMLIPNSKFELHVSENVYDGKHLIDIRYWVNRGTAPSVPTKRGIQIHKDMVVEMIDTWTAFI